MRDNSDIELELSIDENALDQEWLIQPRLYFRYAAELAIAQEEVSTKKARIDVVLAEVAADIRTNPEEYGIGKVTESAISESLQRSVIVKDAKAKLIEAQHSVGILSAAVGALDHRKKALEKLVDLRLSNYFSSPRASERSAEFADDITKESVRHRGRGD